MPESPRPTRRSLLGAAVWTTPAIVVATAAPAFAASTDLTGAFTVPRSGSVLSPAGTVTNSGTAPRTVTFTWTWTCDTTGPGAGEFDGGWYLNPQGWTISSWGYVGTQRTIRMVGTRVVAAGATVPLPSGIFLFLGDSGVAGTGTLSLSAPAPATVTQPPAVRWGAASTAGRAAGRSQPPAGLPAD